MTGRAITWFPVSCEEGTNLRCGGDPLRNPLMGSCLIEGGHIRASARAGVASHAGSAVIEAFLSHTSGRSARNYSKHTTLTSRQHHRSAGNSHGCITYLADTLVYASNFTRLLSFLPMRHSLRHIFRRDMTQLEKYFSLKARTSGDKCQFGLAGLSGGERDDGVIFSPYCIALITCFPSHHDEGFDFSPE